MLPSRLAHLPPPTPEAASLSAELEKRIGAELDARGWLSFERYMALALYCPGLGYYSAGHVKLGGAGDFVTAPELGSLFGQCLARQIAQLVGYGMSDVLEVGGGSGALACEILQALESADRLPERYLMLELSAELRERQRRRIAARVPALAERVQWLDRLPDTLHAIVIANEVLDAMPVHIVRESAGRIEELGLVRAPGGGFQRAFRPAAGALRSAAEALALPEDYQTEINLAARAFVSTLSARNPQGVLLVVDYGFPAAEYYHPQRSRGTLMCHFRHHVHDDPWVLPGLQDITAHVDFTAVADAALGVGHDVLGYTSQAQFLLNCGLTEILESTPAEDVAAYAPRAGEAHKLVSPAEMGELFKVIALGREIGTPLVGFTRGDRAHTL